MNFPPQFLDELRDKILLSDLIGRRVKLTRRGNEYTGLCPFHHEKTPSFTINNEKGFYHCFGCGAHGDIIRYLMEIDKLPFPEAVEHLADMAGIPMPRQSEQQKSFEQQRKNLTEITETACHFFQSQLFGIAGESAKKYLIRRGISGTVAKQFRLGYAPGGSSLTQHLQSKGFDMRTCQALGLVVKNEHTGLWRDYFFNRVMFPILDRRKQVIAFGGRLLEAGEPKYLNSPETNLFHKGEQLYALPNAIETIRKKNEAILVEGYMDVITLHSAGFTNAVAPLGTAFTENQIKILWQSCNEPLICFDGDGAGQKAAIRALYRALPILTSGKSLRFVFLPAGYDPDDVIRKKSPDTFTELLKESRSFSDVLWDDLITKHPTDTPEKMALLEKDINETLENIQDPIVRGYYQKDFKNRIWKLSHTETGKTRKLKTILPIHTPTPGLSDARMALAYLILYPQTAESLLDEIASMPLPDKILENILQQTTSLILETPDIDTDQLLKKLNQDTADILSSEFEMIKKSGQHPHEIPKILSQIIRESKRQILQNEITEKTNSYFNNPNPEIWENIKVLKKEIEKLQESE